jgi:hypothetical protein
MPVLINGDRISNIGIHGNNPFSLSCLRFKVKTVICTINLAINMASKTGQRTRFENKTIKER